MQWLTFSVFVVSLICVVGFLWYLVHRRSFNGTATFDCSVSGDMDESSKLWFEDHITKLADIEARNRHRTVVKTWRTPTS